MSDAVLDFSRDEFGARVNREGVDPAGQLMALLDELGLADKRIGVETRTVGLTAWNWRMLERAASGYVTLVEASRRVSNA